MAYLSKAQKYDLNQVRNEILAVRGILRGDLECKPEHETDLIKDAHIIHDTLGHMLDRLYVFIEQSEVMIPYGDTNLIDLIGRMPDRKAIIARLERNSE